MSKKEHVLDSLFEEIPKEDYNESWCEHKEQFHNLLRKGLYGFIGGVLFFGVLIFTILFASNNTSALAFSKIWPWILAILGIGIICTGFPFGLELLNRLVGQWSIWGSLFVVIALFVFKLAFALAIGMFAYPICLIYHIIKSQKSKRKVRLWTIIVISIVVLWYVFLGICAIITASTESKKNNAGGTEPTVVQTVDVSTFDNHPELLSTVCQNAYASTKEREDEDKTNYGWSVTKPTQIHAVFFLTAKDSEEFHQDFLSNAIVVVTGYFVAEGSGIGINEWEMDAWVYPNYSFDANGVLTYDEEKAYSHSLSFDDKDDFKGWFNSEYNDMTIVELDVPTS